MKWSGSLPDVVVIGGGAMGLTAAWELRQRGLAVTLVERAQPGRAASWASAGIVSSPSGPRSSPNSRLQALSYGLWPAFAEHVRAASGMDPEFRLMGCLIPAWTTSGANGLRTVVWHGAEQEGKLLEGQELRDAEPGLAPDILAALWKPGGNVDNRRLCRALELCARQSGVEFRCGEEVRAVTIQGGRIAGVELRGGSVAAETVIVAAGAWSGELSSVRPPTPVVPQRGQILALDRGDVRLHHVILNPDDPYLVPRADGRVVVGATREMAGWDPTMTAGGVAWLLNEAMRTIPALSTCPIYEQWTGFRPLSPDGIPIIGKGGADGLYMLTGHGPSGIGPLPGSVAVLLASIFGETPPIPPDPYSPLRWLSLIHI